MSHSGFSGRAPKAERGRRDRQVPRAAGGGSRQNVTRTADVDIVHKGFVMDGVEHESQVYYLLRSSVFQEVRETGVAHVHPPEIELGEPAARG